MKPIKFILFVLSIFLVLHIHAQDTSIVKYVDSNWIETTKEKSIITLNYFFKKPYYLCEGFYNSSLKLAEKDTFRDRTYKRPIGWSIKYYEDGKTKDSSYFSRKALAYSASFYKSGALKDRRYYYNEKDYFKATVYYETGQLLAITDYDTSKKEMVSIGYDLKGNTIPYIHYRTAEFDRDPIVFRKFLEKKLNGEVLSNNEAPKGKFMVLVEFTISEIGDLKDFDILQDPGYGTSKEALRVLKKCPKWKPAILYNQPIASKVQLPIIFVK